MTEEVSVSKMNVIIWVSILCGVAYCRPQYNYNPPSISIPSGSYGRPGGGSFINGGGSGSFIGIGGGSSGGFVSGSGISSGSFIGGGSSGGSFIGGGSGINGGGSGGFISSGGGGGFISTGGGSGIGSGGGFISGGSGGGSISSGGGNFIGGGGGTLVQKHVYVHVAPPEPEEIRPQQSSINIGQATKHYKIIFIKAPSYPTPTAQQIALQAQNQEKTLIYVLVKKPDDVADISIPSIAPVQPTKPEVYFIRYKTQSQGGGGVGGGAIGGGSGSIGGGVISGGNGIISSGGSISGGAGGGGIITSSGGSGIDIGSSISGGSIGGGSISGGGLSTNYGPPCQSGPY